MGYTVSQLKNGIAKTRYGGRMGRTKIKNYIVINVWFYSIITTENSISIYVYTYTYYYYYLLLYRHIEHDSISGSYKSVLYFARIAMLFGTKL